ncbi:MAG: hypothetical protein QW225_02845 [Candidatus Jordarchaeales archaeon]
MCFLWKLYVKAGLVSPLWGRGKGSASSKVFNRRPLWRFKAKVEEGACRERIATFHV